MFHFSISTAIILITIDRQIRKRMECGMGRASLRSASEIRIFALNSTSVSQMFLSKEPKIMSCGAIEMWIVPELNNW